MRRSHITTVLVGLLLIGLAATAPDQKARAEALLKEAETIYAGRTDADLRASLAKAEEASRLCPDCPRAWSLLTEIYWMIGDRVPRDQKQKRTDWFVKGEAAADKSIALEPKSPVGLYWKTVNMASAADMKGWSSSLWIFPTLLKNMDEVDRRDPHYYYGASDRFWTEVLCRVPLFLADRFGYKPADIAADLEAEIKLEPRVFCNYTYVARLYWKMDQKDKALDRLAWVLSHDPNAHPAMRGDNRIHQQIARELWKEWTGKAYPAK